MRVKKNLLGQFFLLTICVILVTGCSRGEISFDGRQAYRDIAVQLEFGPRIPGSAAHAAQLDWMEAELQNSGWDVDRQVGEFGGQLINNLLAKRGTGDQIVLLGAHFDSRILADQDSDPEKQKLPVLGANDGASGVAVLLELARILPDIPGWELWIAFFDAEDNGNIEDWNWILGSSYFAENLIQPPNEVVIVDMVADRDLFLPVEGNSDPSLAAEIWQVANQLGYADIFSPDVKHYILDDHLPFREIGIPAVDIIDIEYPYWHTSQDTLINVSPESLQIVGDVLLEWLLQK